MANKSGDLAEAEKKIEALEKSVGDLELALDEANAKLKFAVTEEEAKLLVAAFNEVRYSAYGVQIGGTPTDALLARLIEEWA